MSAITRKWEEKFSEREKSDRADIRKRVGFKKWAFGMGKAREWLDATHKFRMKYGDGFIGPIFEMTGREAKEKNRALESKFWKALNTNKAARLGRWVWIKPDKEEKNANDS